VKLFHLHGERRVGNWIYSSAGGIATHENGSGKFADVVTVSGEKFHV
jgi:hypothetical protein